jgi:hypothetical protein
MTRHPGWHEGRTLCALAHMEAPAVRKALDKLLKDGNVEVRTTDGIAEYNIIGIRLIPEPIRSRRE